MSSSKTPTSPTETSIFSSPQRAMPTILRSVLWNVHIYDSNDPTTVIGGLSLTPGITNANLYVMIEILVIISSTFFLRDENETKIERDGHPLQPGKYYIVAADSFQVNDEPWLVRTIDRAPGTRVAAFCDAVRLRDRRCVISGEIVPTFGEIDLWDGFDAAHIFPLAYEGHWIDQNFNRWITIQPAKGGTINSVQNGLLLDSAIHQLFDAYAVSINPDDNYKVVAFMPTPRNIAGKHLDREYFTHPDAPLDSLLRWHFR
ncbi:uncharacterized protein Z518_06581 [Rhinocladiella mackenziei CBS 650.93]|uniref:HNH nuclease domain-containing protein n=1 Tax=Rhinocladiella mackenziei CBS 650.93 TaxID=1442369 RepID=A0A0D2IID4_9EURO|nr:uncharacterized protein Z518_06581 [Rhinocladiella mackenziei CBS 650.93]KIX03031.1 hypothetical protein Z518_06581 [Rhinocladiella mackenziei CBS 650.93]